MVKENPRFSEFNVSIKKGKDNIQFLVVGELEKKIPIYSIRDLAHHKLIAQAVADEVPMVVYGGVWAVFKGVKRRSEGAGFFKVAKPGRPPESKVPMVCRPEDTQSFIDWSHVHPDFRHLRRRENFTKLWATHGAPLHLVAPIRSSLSSLPEEFKTSPEEFNARYPDAQAISCATAAFYWREDPYWRHFATLTSRYTHTQTYLGVSSFNPHGEEPPYTFGELVEQVKIGRIPFELIVCDHIYENSRAFGSHTQMRLPLVGEEPKFSVLRLGSFSPQGFGKATGFEWKLASENVKDVRKNLGENLDGELYLMSDRIRCRYKTEKPLVCCRKP